MQNSPEKIKELSLQIDFCPIGEETYKQRSQQYVLKGDIDSAVRDLSKSIVLEGSCQAYISRGKLYAENQKFSDALRDYQQAKQLYDENSEKYNKDQNTKAFIENSICIQKLPQIKLIVKHYHNESILRKKSDDQQIKFLLKRVLQQSEDLKKEFNEQKQETQKIIHHYEDQIKWYERLRTFQQLEMQELKKGLLQRPIDYEQKFFHEIENSTMSLSNQDKCRAYYKKFVSEMELYFLAAKVSKDFDEKKFRFEDYCPTEKKDTKTIYWIQKIFVFFDKYSDKISRVEEVIKELPYIGTVFKVIKSAAKGIGWFDSVMVEYQCQNIMRLRSNVTSFNRLSTHLGYLMYQNYKMEITQTDQSIYMHTGWQKLKRKYKDFKKSKIKNKIFPHINEEELYYVNEMAEVHASIIMVGVAYGVLKLDENFHEESNMSYLYEELNKVELRLKLAFEEEQSQMNELNQQIENAKKLCRLF